MGAWDEATGTGTLDMNDGAAHVTFDSTVDALEIAVHAADTDLGSYEDVVGRHLVRFGERDELQVAWTRADGTPGTSQP